MSVSLIQSLQQATYAPFLLLAIVVAAAGWQIFRITTNPLNKIPGPFINRITSLNLTAWNLAGERPRYVHTLHQKYGSVVRLGPNEVSVTDIDAARQVYKVGSHYLKSDFYVNFGGVRKGVASMFSEQDPKAHGIRRQQVSAQFAEKWVSKMEPYIVRKIKLAVQRMADDVDRQGYVDMFQWFLFMATDVIGEAAFGKSFDMVESGKVNRYVLDLKAINMAGAIQAEFPMLFWLASFIPFGIPKELGQCRDRLIANGQQSIDRYWKSYHADPENVKPTLLTKMYGLVEAGEAPKPQLLRDATGFIIAGSDTTSNTLTMTVWELARHPEIERKLIDEVATLPEGFGDTELRQLPFLDAVLHESLRLHSAVSTGLPRVVPPEGLAVAGEHHIPPKTVISIPTYTMHRDESVWTNPETFDPSRWTDVSKDMRDHFMPFGGGSRICIGMHFSKLEMRHTLAEIYRTFPNGLGLSRANGFSDQDMEPVSHFIDGPRAKRCLLERR